MTGGVSRTFWVSKKSPLLAVGAISWKPKTSAKPLQSYYFWKYFWSVVSRALTPGQSPVVHAHFRAAGVYIGVQNY